MIGQPLDIRRSPTAMLESAVRADPAALGPLASLQACL